MTTQEIQTKIIFLLQKHPLFEICTNHSSTTILTVRQLLYHVLQAISVRKIQTMLDFNEMFPNMYFVYRDQTLSMKLDFNEKIAKSQQLFYNLNNQEYEIMRGEKQIEKEKKKNKEINQTVNKSSASFEGFRNEPSKSEPQPNPIELAQQSKKVSNQTPIQLSQSSIIPQIKNLEDSTNANLIEPRNQNSSLNTNNKSSCCLLI